MFTNESLSINYRIYKIILKTTSPSRHYKFMFFLESENSLLEILHKLQTYNLLTPTRGLSISSITIVGLKDEELAEQTSPRPPQLNFHGGSLPDLTDQVNHQIHQIACKFGIKWHFNSSFIRLHCCLPSSFTVSTHFRSTISTPV